AAEPEAVPPPAEIEAHGAAAAAATGVAAHSVPATEPGESTQCPRCGTENRPGIAFCSNCGQRLVAAGAATTVARPEVPEGTQACPRCGTHNRAGVAFCQNCGANLRTAETGYVPPAVAATGAAAAGQAQESAAHAILGPVVLVVGALGMATGWLLPFGLGTGSLYDQAFGSPTGYGLAFWTAYDAITQGLAEQAYFGFAAPVPILVALLLALALAGIARATPGMLQVIGLVISLVWAIGLLALFVVVEVLGSDAGDLLGMLAALSPAGIIFALSSLIVIIGTLTRFGRG
ncbi:MAG TPA: zinc ribbon domain-containing protein, partial [Candidatus Limnocylindria bacterium]|nr:zinc ribbon domain-containing protein [Candidatus Limnocylindria bacterium]